MPRLLQKTDTLLRKTAALAKRRGLKGLTVTFGQIGDAYHVHGVNLTPARLLHVLSLRMKPYSPPTNKGRTRSIDDVHHKTADQPRAAASKTAKALKHSARHQSTKALRRDAQ